jgi:hypothetical protein
MPSKLHEDLVQHACRSDGWSSAKGWRKAFAAIANTNPMWASEYNPRTKQDIAALAAQGYDVDDMAPGELTDYAEAIRDTTVNPDAWRIVVEGAGPFIDETWSYPVLVLEFLEVEVTHGIGNDKMNKYRNLWWAFDASSSFHMRVYHMDKFGITRPYMTTETIYSFQ